MASPTARATPRYRRRILVIGAVLTGALYVIGAPFYNDSIERDLEERVPDELAEQGFVGIAASFSGQDGTLRCTAPLADPTAAEEAAYGVWGVYSVELDDSCRVRTAPVVPTATSVPSTTTAASVTEATDTATTPPSTSAPAADLASVADVIATNPQFSLLALLVQEAGFDTVIGADATGPITLFAPTNEALDALPADSIARLNADPQLLRRVLGHHTVPGWIAADDFVDGPLTTIDGETLDVRIGEPITVSGIALTETDIAAGNGVVHVVEQVLVPPGLDLADSSPPGEVSAAYADGGFMLSGVVATEVERSVLVTAATTAVGAAAVVDALTVDPDVGLDADTAADLASLIAPVREHLVAGVAGFDGETLFVRGSYVTTEARDAVSAAAAAVGATAELEVRPDATEDDAVDLETELNAFVAENPILFQPGSAVLDESAFAVIDRIALDAQGVGGVAITVEGHTDSDGDPTENLVLSRLRALAVRAALIERGIDEASVVAEGFGSQRPILVDGVEDKDASRRVEFRVVVSS